MPMSKHFINFVVKGKKFDFNAFRSREEFDIYQQELAQFKIEKNTVLSTQLHVELIPQTAWGRNVRTSVSKSTWDKIRKEVYDREDYECRFCKEQNNSLHAHEIWEWDEENHIQKLVDIIGICPDCHNTIHYGRAQKIGTDKKAKEHFLKVNQCDLLDWHDELLEAQENYFRRSEITVWELDFSYIENQGYIVKGE